MASSADADAALLAKMIESAMAYCVRQGLIAKKASPQTAEFLSGQIMYTVELVKMNRELTGTGLALFLTARSASMVGFAVGPRFECATALALLSVSLAQSALVPGAVLVKAITLLSDVYSADQSCGFSTSARKQVERVALPMASWLDRAVMELMASQGALHGFPSGR